MATADETSSFTGADTSEDEVVESLVAGRQKRSTAGQNMSSLLNAAADDDLTLLFAEEEDDDEFDHDEGPDGDFDDMRLDSSSEDEEEQGADDELEGEKELEKQAKADRKKRKAQESLRLTALRKKVKIDSPRVSDISAEATPRPKKKSERVSWLPTPEEGPVRSSSRRQTMQNKELTHARLKDSEQRRIKLIATMEEAAKRKQKVVRKVMTQEERLAEAEKIERLNRKTLNRWEEMEKRKAEERKAKLEALQNRRLEGPVMSWWSGIAKWVDGKLVRVGNVEVKPKPEKEETERKKKTKDESKAEVKANEGSTPSQQVPATSNDTPLAPEGLPVEATAATSATVPAVASVENAATQDDAGPQTQQSQALGFLDGIHHYASLPTTPAPDATETEVKAPENEKPESTDDASGKQIDESTNEGGKDEATHSPQGGDGEAKDTPDIPGAETQPENPEDVSEKPPQSEAKPTDGAETQLQDVSPAVSNEAGAETAEAAKTTQAETEIPAESTDKSGADEQAAVESDKATTSPAPDAEQPQQQQQKTTPPTQETAPDVSTGAGAATEMSAMDIDQPVASAEPEPTSAGEPEATTAQPEEIKPEDIEQTGRNLLVLENFDNSTSQSREYSIYFNSKKPPRLTKISSHLCPITSQLSRYRDPDTGLPYANVVGYREIRNLTEQKYTWSGMLGCYVGSANVAAKGVPEQFITGVKPAPSAEASAEASGTGDKEKTEEAMEVDKS